jgi:hypothetical protein
MLLSLLKGFMFSWETFEEEFKAKGIKVIVEYRHS